VVDRYYKIPNFRRKIYLSPTVDCFDGLPVSLIIGICPDAELVKTKFDAAI